MATEKEYDEIIAPLLMDAAKKAEDLGMSFLANVEWEPGKSGTTQSQREGAGIAFKMTRFAALCNGNVDRFCMSCIEAFDVSESMFLHSFNRNGEIEKK